MIQSELTIIQGFLSCQLSSEVREENIFKMTHNLEVIVVMAFMVILLFLVLLYFIEGKCRSVCVIVTNISEPEPLPGEGEEDVWSISIPPETGELPSYEELQANPENKRPPGYWTLFPYKIYYDQPVITETL